jgi:hypothetical protein
VLNTLEKPSATHCHLGLKISSGVLLVSLVDTIVIGYMRLLHRQNTHGRITSSVGGKTEQILEYVST